MMMMNGEMLTQLGSMVGGILLAWAMFQQYVPNEFRSYFRKYSTKLVTFVYPYIQVTFHEYSGNGFQRSKVYTTIETYLSATSSSEAKRLKGDFMKDSQSLVLSMDDNQEVTDEFKGIKLWWASNKIPPSTQSISFYPRQDDKRYYRLTFHKKYRQLITESYMTHVMARGKAIELEKRQRKLYTNNRSESWVGYRRTMWTNVQFEHPATFDTLALEPKMKKDIMNDLITFTKAKDYYNKIGKPWKRGYLLYGPPGTGKSTMIAAMANLLDYDVYDLELTAVKDNTELRKLLIDTSGKSIIVIEDIDCSLDLTGQRKKKEKKEEEEKEKDPVAKKAKSIENEELQDSKVTLSGLLNFIDGLWSACGGERIIVFTTNFVEKLDHALIRRGRMDKHIELSYCCFEAFKVLAKNYLDLDSHHLFATIGHLLEETNITPADVAENLMPKCEEDAEICLDNLIKALEKAKEEAKLKAEEEERLKAEKEEKEKETQKEKEQKSTAEEVKEEKALVEDVKENGVKENGVMST